MGLIRTDSKETKPQGEHMPTPRKQNEKKGQGEAESSRGSEVPGLILCFPDIGNLSQAQFLNSVMNMICK